MSFLDDLSFAEHAIIDGSSSECEVVDPAYDPNDESQSETQTQFV
jgi:hypothetical protein